MEFVTFAQILVGGLGKEIDVIDAKKLWERGSKNFPI